MTTALVIVAAGWVAGWALAGRHRALPTTTSAPPETAVVIPARNEEDTLPALLHDLMFSAPAPAGVLVVDDGSSDATKTVALAAGAKVVATAPPAGWTGKANACWQGALASDPRADVLVFLDADTRPGRTFVSALAAAAQDTDGLVSVQPWHAVERPYEHLSAFCNLVAVMASGTGQRPVAFGPAMAVTRPAYDRIGGHAAVRDAVAEDVALGGRAAACGVPVLALGGGDIRYRMYPAGFSTLVEGWSKNLALGAASVPPARLAATVLWIGACIQAGALPFVTAFSLTALVAYAAVAVQLAVLWRRVGRFGPVTAALFPVPVVAFVALFIRSVWLTKIRRKVRWRGRTVEAA
ncbi:MAG: glycosyltransferase [Acidimicrobiia bacterium]|nr:glycosyltransferase [Acidimicrobiia bacterium]